MLCLSGFELYSGWVPLLEENSIYSLNHAQYIMTHANCFEFQTVNC